MIEAWGKTYQHRTRGHTTGAECIVCGKQTRAATAMAVAASPATGTFVDARIIGTPDGDAIEASAYYVGRDCARLVRRDYPSSVIVLTP